MSADVLPIGAPSRVELWRRLQLARAVLDQRVPSAATTSIVLCALDGVPVETLMRREPAGLPLRFVVDWGQIGRDVRSACTVRNLSQKKLAAALGVGPKTVHRILRGQVLTADLLVTVVAWLYPEEPRPRWIVSSAEEAV